VIREPVELRIGERIKGWLVESRHKQNNSASVSGLSMDITSRGGVATRRAQGNPIPVWETYILGSALVE